MRKLRHLIRFEKALGFLVPRGQSRMVTFRDTRDTSISVNASPLLTLYLTLEVKFLSLTHPQSILRSIGASLHMPRKKRRQILTLRLNQNDPSYSSFDDSDDENIDPNTLIPKPKSKSLRIQLTEKDNIIAQFEATISDLEANLLRLQKELHSLHRDNRALADERLTLSITNKSLNCLKRKAETTFKEELARKHKRIKRLENDRETKKTSNNWTVETLKVALDERTTHIAQLGRDLGLATTQIMSLDATILSLQSSIHDKQSSLTASRNRLYAAKKQNQRAKLSLKVTQKDYKNLRTWDPMDKGQYSTASRELARNLTFAGCSAAKVAFAVNSCARAFGIKVRRRFMSRRSVGRAVDEGGKYGEIQLGREIMDAPGISLLAFHIILCHSHCV